MDDVPVIVDLGRRMHEESSYRTMIYSPERVAETARLLIGHGFAVVAENDGEVIGGMMGDVVTPWYTTERMGIDYALYIAPEHRNGLLAFKLVRRFEEWCERNDVRQIRPGVTTGSMSAGKLYQALGYRQVGETFVKDIGG
jgi:GNAT superfamily N-acetyltransferase